MKKIRVAIVGYGQFGRFMAKHLRPHCNVVPIKRATPAEKVANCDMIIFAVPWSGLADAITRLKPHIAPDAAIVDVMSVKQKPLAVLQKAFKGHEILGTHPIFGPQSGRQGIEGLPIVLCNVSFTKKRYAAVKRFLKQTLELRVIEQTPKQHDADMAQVQALTHLIGRVIAQMDIQSRVTNTKSYEQLLALKELIGDDSLELFKTIQNTNPEAKKVRQSFTKQLAKIEKELTDK